MRCLLLGLCLVLFAVLVACLPDSERDRPRPAEPADEQALVAEQARASSGSNSLPTPRVRRPLSQPDTPLPPAMRQTREGYWLGAMITPMDVPSLQALGVRVVISAVEPDESTLRALEYRGIEQVSVPMSDTFVHGDAILDVADRYEPAEIFIHCQHGADRTGAITAFLLVTRHGWLIPDAFYAVLYQSQEDADGLADVLARYDLPDWRSVDDPSVGFYAEPRDQGMGGLKAHNDRYRRLVETTLDAIETLESGLRSDEWVPWDGRLDID